MTFCFKLNIFFIDFICDVQREKLEREELLIELKCKELHEKQLVLDRKQLEDRIRQRLKTKLELEHQLKDIEIKRLQQKEKEDQFRIEQLKMLAEQDRLEMLTKEKQRIKKQEHHRLVREMLTAREDARNVEIFELLQEHSELMALERRRFLSNYILISYIFSLIFVFCVCFRQEIFLMERQRLLEQHADDIIGYLPKELLQ